ncbi:MAG: iron ABC transporter permease [Phycisphaerales bacterium]|nr:iron ABC transporter permease [Phycisphaerales bacterium]
MAIRYCPAMQRAGRGSWILLIGLLGVLGAGLLYPIWLTVSEGFVAEDGGFTFFHVFDVLQDPATRTGLLNALGIATATTLLCLLISIPMALVSVRCLYPGRRVLEALVLVPLILPPFVGAIGLHHLLGRHGAISSLLVDLGIVSHGIDFIGAGGFWAIVLIEALHLYPIIYLNAAAALANQDPALEEAAQGLGASRWQRLKHIVVPLMRPGLFAGSTIVFIWSLTELGTPLMFDYQQVTPVQIFNGIKEMNVSREPYALTVVLLVLAAGIYLVGKTFLGSADAAGPGRASLRFTPKKLGRWGSVGALALLGGVSFIAMLPHISVVLASLSPPGAWYDTVLPTSLTGAHYSEALSHPLAAGSVRNSLFYASIATGLDIVLGLAIAYLLVRVKIRGRGLLDALAMLPLAVPGLVMAFGYVAMTFRWPFGEGDPLEGVVSVIGANPDPVLLLIVAYGVRRLPYVVRSAVAGLQQTSPQLEEAALMLGASRLTAIRTIVVPLLIANLIAGGLLAFAFAMLEVSDSLILAQRAADFPITKAIYVLFERLGDGPGIASAMGVWAMLLLAFTLVGASVLMGRKLGAVFRA